MCIRARGMGVGHTVHAETSTPDNCWLVRGKECSPCEVNYSLVEDHIHNNIWSAQIGLEVVVFLFCFKNTKLG